MNIVAGDNFKKYIPASSYFNREIVNIKENNLCFYHIVTILYPLLE